MHNDMTAHYARKAIIDSEYAHSHGFWHAYAEALPMKDNDLGRPSSPAEHFSFCCFVSSIYTIDMMVYLRNLTTMAMTDENVRRCYEMFRPTIDVTNATLTKLLMVHKSVVGIMDTNDEVDPNEYIGAGRATIEETMNLQEAILPLINIVTNQGIYVEGCDNVLASMQEFSNAYNALIDSVRNYLKEEENNDGE